MSGTKASGGRHTRKTSPYETLDRLRGGLKQSTASPWKNTRHSASSHVRCVDRPSPTSLCVSTIPSKVVTMEYYVMDVTLPSGTSGTTLPGLNGQHNMYGEPEIMEKARSILEGEGTLLVENVMAAVRLILTSIGEDPNREDLVRTPYRVAKMFLTETLSGYWEDPEDLFTTFDGEAYDEMVILRDIPLASTCAHHLQPFIGKIHVGYIPEQRVVGLSKIVRLVNIFAKRLQLQEKLTMQVANALEEFLQPKGVMVVAEAEHLCMTIRGVQTPGTTTITSAVRGVFLDPSRGARAEFLELTRR